MNKKKGYSYAKYGYLFCIPFALAFLIFHLYPTIRTVLLAFTDSKGIGKTALHFLEGDILQNFTKILADNVFKKAVINTCKIWIVNFIPQIFFALLFTAWFTSRRNQIKGQGFFKVVFYMPNIITAASIAILFNALFAYPVGPANDLLQTLGVLEKGYDFLGKAVATRLIIAFIQFWMWYGYTMITLISGVLGINPEIFEAAEIDGATDWDIFWHITIPNLRSILTYTLITSLIGGLSMYDIPKMLNNGNPMNESNTIAMYIYKKAFSGSYLYAEASAASVLLFIMIGILSIFVFVLMRDDK